MYLNYWHEDAQHEHRTPDALPAHDSQRLHSNVAEHIVLHCDLCSLDCLLHPKLIINVKIQQRCKARMSLAKAGRLDSGVERPEYPDLPF